MHIDRFGAQDTPDEFQQKMYELFRQFTPEQKLQMVMDRIRFTLELRESTKHLRADKNSHEVRPHESGFSG